MVTFLKGKKSYIVALATVIYAIAYYGWDKNNWPEAANFVLGGTGMATVRAAIAKVEGKVGL